MWQNLIFQQKVKFRIVWNPIMGPTLITHHDVWSVSVVKIVYFSNHFCEIFENVTFLYSTADFIYLNFLLHNQPQLSTQSWNASSFPSKSYKFQCLSTVMQMMPKLLTMQMTTTGWLVWYCWRLSAALKTTNDHMTYLWCVRVVHNHDWCAKILSLLRMCQVNVTWKKKKPIVVLHWDSGELRIKFDLQHSDRNVCLQPRANHLPQKIGYSSWLMSW